MHVRRSAIKVVSRAHRDVYRLSGGRVLGRVADMPVLLLTTTGRRTGRQTTTPLTYFETGDDIVVVGSNGGEDTPPSWWRNLHDHPSATITRGKRSEAVTARAATEAEHECLWPMITGIHPGYARYAGRTSRPMPLVVLSPGGTKENAPGR